MAGYIFLLFLSPYIVYKIVDFIKFYKWKQPNLHGNTISQCQVGEEWCKYFKVDSTGEVSYKANFSPAMGKESFKNTSVSCRVDSCIEK